MTETHDSVEVRRLRARVDALEATLQRIRDVLNGDRGAVSGDAQVIRDCIVDAIDDVPGLV